jgi:PAS domain S-box-containing protein
MAPRATICRRERRPEAMEPVSNIAPEALEERLAAAQAQLARAERQLIEAQQLARIGSWEWDIPANLVWWSDELYRIYGLEPRVIAPSYEEFLARVHPDDRPSVDERNRRAFEDHQPFEDVKRVIREDGREILMRTHGEVVLDDRGAPVRMVGICEDVTDELRAREAERQLAAATALRRRAAEINEEIIQRLVIAIAHLERGDADRAVPPITEARYCAQRIATDLVLKGGFQPGDLRRDPTEV